MAQNDPGNRGGGGGGQGGGGGGGNRQPVRRRRFSGLANLATFIMFFAEVVLTALSLWIFLRPNDVDGTVRTDLPPWWVNDYHWMLGIMLIAVLAQIVMLIVPLYVPPHSQYSVWRSTVSFLDSATNYVGFFVLIVYLFGFNPELRDIADFIMLRLTNGGILMLLVIGFLAEVFKHVSHMLMDTERIQRNK